MGISDLWRWYGWAESGRPGQIIDQSVYCPLLRRWTRKTAEGKISSSRTQYDEIDKGDNPSILDSADDFNKACLESGWKLPDQLHVAVSICQFCEVNCLGKSDGPNEIPPYEKIE